MHLTKQIYLFTEYIWLWRHMAHFWISIDYVDENEIKCILYKVKLLYDSTLNLFNCKSAVVHHKYVKV